MSVVCMWLVIFDLMTQILYGTDVSLCYELHLYKKTLYYLELDCEVVSLHGLLTLESS